MSRTSGQDLNLKVGRISLPKAICSDSVLGRLFENMIVTWNELPKCLWEREIDIGVPELAQRIPKKAIVLEFRVFSYDLFVLVVEQNRDGGSACEGSRAMLAPIAEWLLYIHLRYGHV